jgi:hypothetical protein
MTSFISKIFGSKKRNLSVLAIHDDCLEAMFLTREKNGFKLEGANSIFLGKDVMENGDIKSSSLLHEAIEKLLAESKPEPINTESALVNIPFQRLFSFVKVFPAHLGEEDMKADLACIIDKQAPFEANELIINFYKNTDGVKVAYGAIAYPKNWANTIRGACSETGIKNVDFMPEPMIQSEFAGLGKGNYALFSMDKEKIYLSLFYKGILYDSFALESDTKDAEAIFGEFIKESDRFYLEFNEKIESINSIGATAAVNEPLMKIFEQNNYKYNIFDKNKLLPDFLMSKDFSTTLVGLAMKAIEE